MITRCQSIAAFRVRGRVDLFVMTSIVCCLLLLPGCGLSNWAHNGFKIGPEYCPPTATVADDWIDASDAHLVESVASDSQWWSTLNDPILDGLINTAYQQNLSLREAGWRVEQARAARAIAAGNLFPQSQQGFGQYERNQGSESLAVPSPLRSFSEWSTGLSMAWEVDVWGRYRRSIASADANVQIAVGDYDAILLCLISEVATSYTDYRTAQLQLQYAKQNLQIQESSLKLTQEKADLGATGYTGVYLARSSLESTRAGIPNIKIRLRQATNQLCTLLGMPTQDLVEMLGSSPIPSAPPEVAVGIPANLLRRRPDIRAAERAVAAQSEQIGIALADLYPSFSITGEFALASEQFSDLFKSASTTGAVGPGFQWDLLNYGRIANNVELQKYGLQELIANYQNAVLTANQEVEDAMVAFLETQERYRALKISVTATEEALKLLTLSFEEGDIDFSSVFLLQGELVGDQDELAQAQGDIVTRLISLYKALGGGWEIRCRVNGEMDVADSSNLDGVQVVSSGKKRQLENDSIDEFPESISAVELIHRAFSRNEPRLDAR
jgi:NodT family efflux transporter outer membrane factor (OMF) lipoprotein